MLIRFWGTRGSIPVPGNTTLKYGGNTPCVEVRSSENKLLILDGGSGIRELGKHIVNSKDEEDINIFISHYHWIIFRVSHSSYLFLIRRTKLHFMVFQAMG